MGDFAALFKPSTWADEGAFPTKPFPLGGRWLAEGRTDEEIIPPKKAFPSGGRWPEGPDEGAMIERFFVGPDALIGPLDGSFRRGISPPAGGDLLFPWRKRRQNATGDAADGLRLRFAPPRSIGPLSPDPITGDAYLSGLAIFPARKI